MRRLALGAGLALFVAATLPGELPTGEVTLSPDGLFLIPDGIRAYQISSYDRSGGNDDGNRAWAYLDFNRAERSFTIFEATGPGRLSRFWMTGWRDPEALRLVVDGKEAGVVPVRDLFSGDVAPFTFPLAGDEEVSSGGFYSYVPFDYDRSLTIETSSVSRYIQLQHYHYADAVSRRRENARVDLIDESAYELIRNTKKLASLDAGRTLLVARLDGPGIVERLGISLPVAAVRAETMEDVLLDDLVLLLTADGASQPQIRAPLSELAGGTLTGEPVTTAAGSVSVNGGEVAIELGWPMPFADDVRIELENRGDRSPGLLQLVVEHRVVPEIATLLEQGTIGHLHARHRRQGDFVPGRDVELIDWRGAGRLVGVILVASSADPENRRILEGDDRIYIDGASTPQIHGTGTEDFFNGGWYYSFGPFSLPTHGNPAHLVDAAGDHTTQYRYLLTDSIPFEGRLRMTMEHGPTNNLAGVFSSTVLFYGVEEQRLRRVQSFDAARLASAAGVSVHQFEAPLVGTDDPTVASRRGVVLEEPITFEVDLVEPGSHVLLRRLTDLTLANQRAEVYVNGELAGEWLTPGFVNEPGIVSSEFLAGGGLTDAGRRARIEIRPLSPWSATRLEVFSVLR